MSDKYTITTQKTSSRSAKIVFTRKTLTQALVEALKAYSDPEKIGLITGHTQWLPPHLAVDEWARTLEMRKNEDHLVKGGQHLTKEQVFNRRSKWREGGSAI